ncbi:MAG: hypothetical protein ACLSF2_04840 [Butyricicoccus sp.]
MRCHQEKLDGTTATKIRTAKVDADNVDELCALIDDTSRTS